MPIGPLRLHGGCLLNGKRVAEGHISLARENGRDLAAGIPSEPHLKLIDLGTAEHELVERRQYESRPPVELLELEGTGANEVVRPVGELKESILVFGQGSFEQVLGEGEEDTRAFQVVVEQ